MREGNMTIDELFDLLKSKVRAQLPSVDNSERNIVTELCPHCETEVELIWDVEMFGYKAYCPFCGKRLMLCDECQHPNGMFSDDCDYDSETDSCKYNKGRLY